MTGPARPGRRRLAELALLVAIVALAAVTRLPGLDQRGRWDADQGHDMLVLRALVTDGEIPLLGPKTSIGTFHHGAVYYYLLAPAAWLSGADPVAVTGEIALFGIAAVAAAWWLARMVGGPVAAAAAGFLAAVSPSGIDESTFIWNPNLVPLAAALALGGALRAWQTGRPRWWLLAGLGAMVTMQCHVLGVVVVPPLVVAWLADLRRRRAAGVASGPLLKAGVGALAIVAAGFLPLLAHELQQDFSETRAILAYLAGGGTGSGAGIAERLAMVGLRSVTWPLAGLVTDHTAAALAALAIVAILAGVAVATGRRADRAAVGFLLGTLAWSVAALAVFAPSLATITPGLPNDHYHAFLDPVVVVLAGAGVARLAGMTGSAGGADRPAGRAVRAGRAAAGVALAALAIIAVVAWPPEVADDGGWRQVDAAAARVVGEVPGQVVTLDGIPPFKSADALRFPLERRGLTPAAPGTPVASGPAVVVCDPLFDSVVGAACGGPAEDAWLAANASSGLRLLDRFDAGPRRVISVYAPGG